MDYYSLKRKELRDLCKKHHLPANVSNLKMADSLSALFKIEQVSEKVERRTISSMKGPSSGNIGVGGDTKVAKTVRFLDQEKPNEWAVSKVAYQLENMVFECGPRRRKSILGTERSSSDGAESEETEAIPENRNSSRRITRSQAAKATDAMEESEQAPANAIGGDTKVAKTVRFLDQEKPNEWAVSKVAYQPENMVFECGLRRRKSILGTERSSSDGAEYEETEAIPENRNSSRRITRSQAAKATDAMEESEQAPANAIGGDTNVAKTVRFLDQEKSNEWAVSKVAYQPENIMSDCGPRIRRKSILGTERSSSDGAESEETEAIPENRNSSRRITRSQAAKATDAMDESEQAPANAIGGDTKVANTVRFLDQEKPNEVPNPEVTYQPEKTVSESGLRTRRKSLRCTKRSSSERTRSEEKEAVPENHETLRRITRSQAAKGEDTVTESEQVPVAEKERKTRTKKAKNEKRAHEAIHRMDEPCPTVVIVLSSEEEDEKNTGKGDGVEKMIPPGIACRSRQVTVPAKGNGCDASKEEALTVNELQQNRHKRRKTRKMIQKSQEDTQSDGRILTSEPHVHTKANDAETKALAKITCENAVNSTYSAGIEEKKEFHLEYGGNRVRNTSARTRSQKKLRGAKEEVGGENKENEPILRGKPSRKSRRRAALKNESANFIEGDSLKSRIGDELQQAANTDKSTEQIKLCASQKQTHGSTDEAGKVQEDRIDHGNTILKRSRAPRQRKERIVKLKKDFERQGDLLTSDCEGDQEDNSDQVEAAEASATFEILEAAITRVFLSSSTEVIEMKSLDKELQNFGKNLQQNHSLEDLRTIEENNGFESIYVQCEHPDLKTEDTDDRKEMVEDVELIERPGSEIALEHENTLTSSSDQEQDTNELHDQHVIDVYLEDDGLVHEKKDEQFVDQHQSHRRQVNMHPGDYNGFEKEKGSLLDKSGAGSETALASPNGKTIMYLPNVNVELQYHMPAVGDEAVHEVLDEEKETPQAVPTVQDVFISNGVPNESPGMQEASATNAQFSSENNADAEPTGNKGIALDYVSSRMPPMSPAMEQSQLGDFMSNDCSLYEFKDHDEDTVPKSITRPRLELGLGVDAVAESKEKQDITSYSALMNKIISSPSGQNDNGKSVASPAITNIDLLNGGNCKKVEDPKCTNEVDAEDIEDENESLTFTTETRYHGLTKDTLSETCQTEGQELREVFVPKCGSDACPIIIAMLHSDPACHLGDEVAAPKSSCVAELDSEASEVPFLKKGNENKCLVTDLSSEKISTDSPHVLRGATYGGGKNMCDRSKESSSEAQNTDTVSETELVTKADTAMMKKQREMVADRSGKESNLQNLEYPEDEKCSISYDLSQAISNESQCPANGCITDPSAVPASDRIEKHIEATFSVEAFAEGYVNEFGNNHHASEVSNVKRTTCSSSDDEEIKAYDYFDNDGEANVDKSSVSFNYFEKVGNGGDFFLFYPSITENEIHVETTHEEFDQIHGNETFIHGDIRLADFDDDAYSFEGSESDKGSKCTTQAHDAEKDSIQDGVKDNADICSSTFRRSQFLFHGFISQHGIFTNTDILEDNQQTKSIQKKAAAATEGVKDCASVRKDSKDTPNSYERNNSLVEERFLVVDENARLILHETHTGESNHHFPVTEIFQDVPQIGEHKGCTETMDAAADQQKVELASCNELQEVVQDPQSTFKEPGLGSCAVEGVREVNKFVFEKFYQTEPEAEGAQDQNGTAESYSEDLNLEDAVVVHTPVTEYQNVQKFEEHKNQNEIMDVEVDANQETNELNQREQQEAEEISQSSSKELDHDHCIVDMKQANKFVLDEHDQTESERANGKNEFVDNCSEDLRLEDAVVVLTPVTKFYHVQRFEEPDVHSETMATDANQSKDELANHRELQEAKEGTQSASKEPELDQRSVDVKQVNAFILREHDPTEFEGDLDKNGTIENCLEVLSQEDAVAFQIPIIEFYHVEHKDHSETVHANEEPSFIELADQRVLQEVDEGTQSASKELHYKHCSVDVKQVNKFFLEDYNPKEPEGAQNQNETLQSGTVTLGQEVKTMVHIPVKKNCQYVLQIKEDENCRETVDMDGDRQKVELVNQGELQELQSASKEPKLDHCPTKNVEEVNRFALQEHNQMEAEGALEKNKDVESSSADLSSEDQVVVYAPVKETCKHVWQSGHRDCNETMDADADQEKVELLNGEVLQEVNTKSSSDQLVLEETVKHSSQNLSPVVKTLVQEISLYDVQIEDHKDCKETMDPDSDRQKVELTYENQHQEGEEIIQISPKVPRPDACAIENYKVFEFTVEEHDQIKPDEAQDGNEDVQSSSQNLGPEDATSFKEEEDVNGTEDDQNEDGTKISQLADVEEAEGITRSSPLNPNLESASVIDEEHREEASNSEGEDWISKFELRKDVTDESYEEKKQLSRTVIDGANRENGKANEASPQDMNVPDREADIIAGSHANGEIAEVEDGIENDEVVHPKREENESANSPTYPSKFCEDGKGNDEVARIRPVEAELSTKLGETPSGTDDIDAICNMMSMILKISVSLSPLQTSRDTGKSPMRSIDEEAGKGVEVVSSVPESTERETAFQPSRDTGKSPMRSIDEKAGKGVEVVSSVPESTERETAFQPSQLTVVPEKSMIGKETLISPTRRWKEEARKENTPSLTIGTKSTKVKEMRATATRRRPLQAISGNNGDGFHGRLDFTRFTHS